MKWIIIFNLFIYLIIASITLLSCKKPKPVTYKGQLLLTKSKPIPLSNKKIEIFQSGGNAIIMGSSSSSATSVTDANGFFSITFTPGSFYFAGLSGESSSPLTLSSFEGYPDFIRRNFPDSSYDATKPIYMAKLIDSLFIKVICFNDIIPSDTFLVSGRTILGFYEKKFTGIRADSSATISLDTIYNAIFSDYDCIDKMYTNNQLEFGRLKTYPGSSSPYYTGQSLSWQKLSAQDEIKHEMLYYYYNK